MYGKSHSLGDQKCDLTALISVRNRKVDLKWLFVFIQKYMLVIIVPVWAIAERNQYKKEKKRFGMAVRGEK